jgi:hypothetical protein
MADTVEKLFSSFLGKYLCARECSGLIFSGKHSLNDLW